MKPTSLYIHLPFCKSICSYCDFAKVILEEKTLSLYMKRLKEEFFQLPNRKYKTIYIGGGTPSALPFSVLDDFLSLLVPYLSKNYELSIEANVEDICEDFLKILQKNKVNRLSIGVQTFQDHLIPILSRHHTKKTAIENILLAKSYIANINIDLIYGLPKQTLADIQNDLQIYLTLDVQHLSYYSLQVEPNTIFYQKNIQSLQDLDLQAKMYDIIFSTLKKHRYYRYEVSNFAKKGFRSRHNLVYWHNQHYFGIGLYASGYIDNIRYTNTRNLTYYLQGNNKKEEIILSKEDKMFEQIMLNLRLDEGLNITKFNQQYACDFLQIYQKQIAKLTKEKLIQIKNNKIKATYKGTLLLNQVLEEFLS